MKTLVELIAEARQLERRQPPAKTFEARATIPAASELEGTLTMPALLNCYTCAAWFAPTGKPERYRYKQDQEQRPDNKAGTWFHVCPACQLVHKELGLPAKSTEDAIRRVRTGRP